jgi:hypothetical protein
MRPHRYKGLNRIWRGFQRFHAESDTYAVPIAGKTVGWAESKPMAGHLAVPYALSVAGALIASTLFGCL